VTVRFRAPLPNGHFSVNVVKGWLDVRDEASGAPAVAAAAAVTVRLDL
jgi:hypothetical protein